MDEQPTPKSDELRDLIQSLIAGMTSGYQEFKAMEQRLAEATTLLERFSKGEPNWFTGELCFYPEEGDFPQLMTDLRAFLAQ